VTIRSFVRIVPLVVCLASAHACGGDLEQPNPSAEECGELGNSLVGFRMQTVTADREQHEANLEAALPAFVISCQAHMTPREVLCARSAKDLESFVACSPQ
jgi:hypothetical protein